MTQREHSHQSVWHATAAMPSYAPLAEDLRTDVCIVGAGIAGLTTAYQLARRGVQVAVLDASAPGAGQSGLTTAQLTCMLDKGYAEIERLHGVKGATMAAASHLAAIDAIEQTAADEAIACDFARLDGYIFLAPGDDPAALTDELAAARRAGLTDTAMVDRLPVEGFPPGPGLRFPHQGHFHVLRYLGGLCAAIQRLGGKIYGQSHVVSLAGGAPTAVKTSRGAQVHADATVVATHAPIHDLLGYSVKVFAYRTYVIAARIPRGSVPPLLAFDTADPYHYVRIQPAEDHDLLIVGGEDHRTGQPDEDVQPFIALEQWTRKNFPMAGEVAYRWSGQVLNSADGLALIGRDLTEAGVYVITGQTGTGMTHGTLGGLITSDLITGRPNPWVGLYDPGRFPLRSAGEVVQENVDTVAQYGELVTFGDVVSEDEIPAHSGAVLGWGPAKVAVYRDPQGAVHRISPFCAHLGCVVAWNDIEKSWDCPCHGSRYDAYGRVINGPSAHDLGKA